MQYDVRPTRILVLLIVSLGISASAAAGGEQKAFPHLSRAVGGSRPAMVAVRSLQIGSDGRKRTVARNTGFLVSDSGDVVTSLYVWVQDGELEVVASDGRRSKAQMKGVDQHTGLALLRTDLEDTPHLRVASSPPQKGEWIVAGVARARASDRLDVLYSPGRLSSTNQERRMCGVKWQGLLTIDVAVVRGGAAAPVLDENGRLAAVILAGEKDDRGDSRAVAIGPDQFEKSLEVMRGGGRRTGWLGVVLSCDRDDDNAARVEAVLPGSPAHAAGLRRGDLLLSLDDRKVTCAAVLEDSVVRAEPGTEVTASIRRDGKEKQVRVRIGPRPLHIPE